jgi:hypothetical protein
MGATGKAFATAVVVATVALGALVGTEAASARAAGAAKGSAAVGRAAACVVRDGRPRNGGVRLASVTVPTYGTHLRYRFEAQPTARPPVPLASAWIGARYDTCYPSLQPSRFSPPISIAYGGYLSATHYNVLWRATKPGFDSGIKQKEVEGNVPGRVSLTYLDLAGSGPLLVSVAVQACKRGGFLASSRCSPWSPTLVVPMP